GSTPGVLQACALVDEEGVDGGDDGRELVRFVEVLARVGEPEQDFFQLRGILSALGESGKGPLPAVLAVVLRHPLPAGVLQEASDLVPLAVIEVLVAADDAGQFLPGVGIQDAEWGLRSHAGPSVLVPAVSSSSAMSVAATGSVVSALPGASAAVSASPSSEERASGVRRGLPDAEGERDQSSGPPNVTGRIPNRFSSSHRSDSASSGSRRNSLSRMRQNVQPTLWSSRSRCWSCRICSGVEWYRSPSHSTAR